MRNQPFSSVVENSESSRHSFIDPPAEARFRILAVLFSVASFVVLGRIAWVQARLQDRYLAVLNTTTVEYELIPARDGRILSESSDVLATDVDQYSVQVHYRWLQKSFNETWLNRHVANRLSRAERKDSTNVERLELEVENQRQQMWQMLAKTIKLDDPAFARKQSAIEEQVERIADSVNRRHRFSSNQTPAEPSDGFFFRLASSIRSALTTAPSRSQNQRIVVREEESYHEVFSSVPLEIAAAIREQPHLFPGVRVIAGNRRTYPLNSVAPHIVGARTPAKAEEQTGFKQTNNTTSWIPRLGRFGVERSYDLQLRGVPGLRRVVRNRRMEVIESEIERTPVSGRDLLLTINLSLQKHAEQLLGEALHDRTVKLLISDDLETQPAEPQSIPTGGSIVVMDVTTGRILTAASAPAFDLSLYTGSNNEDWQSVNADQRFPFLSRTIQSTLPPGSVMKAITAVAAIESGGLDPDATFHCNGYLRQPDEHRCMIYRLYQRGHNDISLRKAIAQSCNVYFFAAAQRMGFSPLRLWADQFGLGRDTGIDLPFERSGNLPGAQSMSGADEKRFAREALGLAIGQSSLTVTPLQMTRAMAAIANGGWLVTPHVVSPDGTARATTDIDDRPREISRQKIRRLSAAALQHVREGLRAVVEEPYGSGYKNVRLEEVTIAGKTGTAETKPGSADHSWFAGYVPADEPRYAFVVVLEHGGSGSQAAGPLARELVRKMWAMRLVSGDETTAAKNSGWSEQ